jgi:hypothetical protein
MYNDDDISDHINANNELNEPINDTMAGDTCRGQLRNYILEALY